MKRQALLALSASLAVLGLASQGVAQKAPRPLSQSSARQAAQQHPQIVAEFGGEETGPRAAYVAAIGRKVAANAGVQGNAFRFTVLNSPVNNAFAVPGGHIYITRQLLGLMNDEAELALVLGHEVGHIDGRHSRERSRGTILSSVLAGLAGIVTGSSQIAQAAGQIGQTYLLSFSRNQEYEADDFGIRYISSSGYDPNAAASIFSSLGAATNLESRAAGRSDERSTPSWARTHPLSEDRVRRATAQAQRTGFAGRGARNRDQFLAQIDGLLVGDDPRQGVIEGRDFLHPDLRLAFTAPQGYGMQNGSRAVSIVGSNGQAQFSTGQFRGDLGSYILQVYQGLVGQQMGQLQIPQPRATNVNGIPAAYTTTRVATQQGQLDVSVFAYQWDADTAYHFVMITQAGAGIGPFAPMVGSVRRLSTADVQGIRPRVIDVVTVRPGDTVQSLAGRMAYQDLRLERFLTLNALRADSQLRPGDKVKLVVYGARQG